MSAPTPPPKRHVFRRKPLRQDAMLNTFAPPNAGNAASRLHARLTSKPQVTIPPAMQRAREPRTRKEATDE